MEGYSKCKPIPRNELSFFFFFTLVFLLYISTLYNDCGPFNPHLRNVINIIVILHITNTALSNSRKTENFAKMQYFLTRPI